MLDKYLIICQSINIKIKYEIFNIKFNMFIKNAKLNIWNFVAITHAFVNGRLGISRKNSALITFFAFVLPYNFVWAECLCRPCMRFKH